MVHVEWEKMSQVQIEVKTVHLEWEKNGASRTKGEMARVEIKENYYTWNESENFVSHFIILN